MRLANATAPATQRANDSVNVIAPLAETILTTVQHFSTHSLSTPGGAEKAARYIQLALAARGLFIVSEVCQ